MHQQVENRVDDDDFGRSLSSCGQPQFVFLAAAETGVAIHATTWRTHLTLESGRGVPASGEQSAKLRFFN